ncbi:AAA family ATPase [Cronobacter dublinensis]|uniref:AAA family ATPase n=1 Tax=Cronobacter dublinensis TaxID=413497 RepID=UPI0018F8847A|nr:Lon protease family protein [Cronobacter dublinensis]
MTINRLTSQALVPDTATFESRFDEMDAAADGALDFEALQPRLYDGLSQLCAPRPLNDFMLVKADEETPLLELIAGVAKALLPEQSGLAGGHYLIEDQHVTLVPPDNAPGNFAVRRDVVVAAWAEAAELFGCVRHFAGKITLAPGLVHKANGGILVVALKTLLMQPLLWMRLKQMVIAKRFDWMAPDESRPLPVSVPSLPLSLRVVLVGDRESLADFQEMEPVLAQQAIYSEYEDDLQIADEEDVTLWCSWVCALAQQHQLPEPASDAWPLLIREAVRYTGDQETLPLDPLWMARQLGEVAALCDEPRFTAAQFAQMLARRAWREGYLAERMQDEILLGQLLVETEGERIGQINALSVVEFPGHPRAFGEPSRISCVVHIGDGEFTDIERKAELGGNIHAKGMMIMQAFLMAELDLEQQMPFSASLTFEQSYSEVDGDSASMAELCALISALANAPLNQQIAITGSVDQFGRAQPVGGLNEKIEGFFTVCQARGLTGKQGVIIPAANVRHLSLCQEILDAVDQGQFSIWAIDDVTDALPLLTTLPWDGEGQTTLLGVIGERIAQATQQDIRQRPWPLRWMNWFNHN